MEYFGKPVWRYLYVHKRGLKNVFEFLKMEHCSTGNQCNSLRTGVILENLLLFVNILARPVLKHRSVFDIAFGQTSEQKITVGKTTAHSVAQVNIAASATSVRHTFMHLREAATTNLRNMDTNNY